ncbi:MAG: AmmeMemoRadiSam system protein B [bacterium]
MIVVLALVLSLAAATASKQPSVRPPAVAGQFYPADAGELSRLVQTHLDAVDLQAPSQGDLLALIVPHAGLVYSGSVAAYGYGLLADTDFKRVVLCGPSHRFGFQGAAVAFPGQVWRTPLGDVICDSQWCALSSQQPGISILADAHRQEHSLEVQLPYLQTVLADFSIVPIALGYQDSQGIDALYQALLELPWDDRTLLVASTDWQHYRSAAEGWPIDSLGLDCVLNLDAARLQRELQNKAVEACGGGAVAAILKTAVDRGANRAVLLKYGDSGDKTGDKSSVVGYAALAVYRVRDLMQAEGGSLMESDLAAEDFLSSQHKEQLLEIARRSIETYLHGQAPPDFQVDDLLSRPGAAFVTLKREGRLRGCIGYTEAVEPLFKTVSQCAVSAAFSDHRFPPVAASELARITIEISALTPLKPVGSLDEIEVGRDGLMIIRGRNRGLLLPQVAVEQGWDREAFLENTCRKAGLALDCYRQEATRIFRFQALIFSEPEK